MPAWVRAFLGIAFGVALLWVALAQVDVKAATAALLQADPRVLVFALALYWIDIALRIARWRGLLAPVKPLAYPQIGRALIVGYAVNNVLPARLGEIFRADFMGRQFGVARAAALGSIIVERMLDGILVIVLFGGGLMLAAIEPGQDVLKAAAAVGAVGLLAGASAIVAVMFYHQRLPLDRLPWLRPRVAALADALAVVHGPEIVRAVLLTVIIWTVECAALYLVIVACGIVLTIPGLWLVVGAASLSTLLPSAPGYIGSFQIAFVLAFAALGREPVPGVIAATLTQLVLLGSVTVVGLALLAVTYVKQAQQTRKA